MTEQGCFISLEGGEGVGKSTLADALEERLRAAGHTVLRTREPGGTTFGESVRALVLDPAHEGLSAWSELFLMLAARAQLVHQEIRPALERGEIVLCDRFADASVAYQGVGRELGFERVRDLNSSATGGCMPDLTLFLDLDPRVGRARQSGEADRMEREEMHFHERVREGYQLAAKAEPDRIHTLNASLSAAEVLDYAWILILNVTECKSS
ncbi:dTMP kinase [bacterium]|nr:MAG: dTMP kinase [bacterium]RKZ13377.1 MAG: dTMP kinase [bacterium]